MTALKLAIKKLELTQLDYWQIIQLPTNLRVLLVVVLLRANPSADEVVSNGVCQRKVVVAIGGDITVLHHCVVNVPTERLFHVGHILHDRNASHTDLLAAILIGLRLCSHYQTVSSRLVAYLLQTT